MKAFLEKILGLDQGFLSRPGEFSVQFNPRWPFQDTIGAATWNLVLAALAIALVIYVYRREGRSRPARISLGLLRACLLAFVIAMLNRPVLNLGQSRTEPSVVAVLIDDSVSMRVKDHGLGASADGGLTRFEGALTLLTGQDEKLVRDLARQHTIKFYRFSKDATPLFDYTPDNRVRAEGGEAPSTRPTTLPATAPSTLPAMPGGDAVAPMLATLTPDGQATQILASLRTVIEGLQGQRLAGVVVLSDGRDVPTEAFAEALTAIKNLGVKVYPVAVGADKQPQNLTVESVSVQEAAFVKDIVSVRAKVRGMGYPAGHPATVVLKARDPRTKAERFLLKADGKEARESFNIAGDAAQEVEVTFKPGEVGNLDLVVEVTKQPGEVDEEDNRLPAQIAVLDAKISVLYVDGYPRWEYRYLKNGLIRDATVDVSCLLFSADMGFAQEGDKPITRFPESMSEMLQYDVILFGDVDPRQFTDKQLQDVQEFVSRKGGGFGMIAGPKWSPVAFKNTPIESLLPVFIDRDYDPSADTGNITVGWRPVLTKEGETSTIFRFFEDKERNARFLKEEIQPLFWYAKGVGAKPGVGEVYAEHPHDTRRDGRKAPLLVLGRFGTGRTLFSGIDDSWRWRFYTGESVFDTYWVQQLRYLARSKKLGQRRFALATLRPSYEIGEQVQVSLRVLDPELLQQLPEQIGVTVVDAAGNPVRQESMVRQEGQADYYVASWTADSVGQFTLRLPALAGAEGAEQPIAVKIPRLELSQPAVDRTLLSRIASETNGELVEYEQARAKLPVLLTSAAKIVPVDTHQRLWDAPLAMVIFVLLITLEWVLRKVYGML